MLVTAGNRNLDRGILALSQSSNFYIPLILASALEAGRSVGVLTSYKSEFLYGLSFEVSRLVVSCEHGCHRNGGSRSLWQHIPVT